MTIGSGIALAVIWIVAGAVMIVGGPHGTNVLIGAVVATVFLTM